MDQISKRPGRISRRELGKAPKRQAKSSAKVLPSEAVKSPLELESALDGSPFESILFLLPEIYLQADHAGEPECFADLNLDQVVGAIVASREEYDLKGYFHSSLTSVDDIEYRHEIVRDLENTELLSLLRTFAEGMRANRKGIEQAEKLRFRLQKESWFLAAVDTYCRAVAELAGGLDGISLKSRGMSAFRSYVRGYVDAERFSSLRSTLDALKRDLAHIHYCIYIAGGGFTVHKYREETDYSAEIEKTFAKFRQGDAKDYHTKLQDWVEMNHIEEKILEFVSLLWPDVFARLWRFHSAEKDAFLDPKIARFDREIQFYLSYLDHIGRLKEDGLSFCLPVVSEQDKAVKAIDSFDIALAAKLSGERARIVCNDFSLSGQERILVVSGPNQGGKTTFSRTFGQMHYLASLGLPVPGREARLFLFDTILTHFEREEDISNLRGKLQDDLVRVHDILGRATSQSVIIMNEIFTSTTLQDATFLSEKVMRRIIDLDILCVWVTFIHELATFSDTTVSMVSTVDEADPNTRTYKVVRKPASGRSYAMSIAEKYGLTKERLRERIGS